MRAILFVAIALFSLNAVSAQEKKDQFIVNGDLIEATLYHDNGVVAQTGFYTKENKLQGQWTSFDQNGIKTAEAYYEEGKKVGTWKFYDGAIVKEVTYNDAAIAKVTTMEIKSTQIVSNK